MTESNAQSPWLTLAEAVEELHAHESTVRRWADRGAIKTVRTPGGQRRFSREDVQRLAAEGYQVDTGAAHPLLLVAVVLVAWIAAFNTPPGTLLVGVIGVCGAIVLAGFAWAAGVRTLAARVAIRGRRD